MASKMSWIGGALTLGLAGVVGCSCCPDPPPDQPVTAIVDPVYATSDLSEEQRRRYYYQDEGIQYFPIDILASLSRAKSGDGGAGPKVGLYKELFLEKPERFGLFRVPAIRDDLPVGLTLSEDRYPIAGINCVTCHTGLVRNAAGKFLIVDGAPSLFAVNRFIGEMAISAFVTATSISEFDEFYARYTERTDRRMAAEGARGVEVAPFLRETPDTQVDEGKLKESNANVDQLAMEEAPATDPRVRAEAEKLVAGKASIADPKNVRLTKLQMRLYLLERALRFQTLGGYAPEGGDSDMGRANPWGGAKNYLADRWLGDNSKWQLDPGGPISTPYIWGFDRIEHVFWAGVTNSLVERDYAQGIALLSEFDTTCTSLRTTVSIRKLHEVRRSAASLTAPAWPAEFLGPIDGARAARGKTHYDQRCRGCHDHEGPPPPGCAERAPLDANGQPVPVGQGLFRQLFCEVGTDSAYVRSLMEKSPKKRAVCGGPVSPGPGDLMTDFLGPVFHDAKSAAYRNEGLDQAKDEATYEGNRRPAWWLSPIANAIVAKPLRGSWASAPYLHNGSVPTMWDLLSEPSQRPTEFVVGAFDYDVEKLGFRSDPKETLPTFYSRVFVSPNALGGASNGGHYFSIGMTDDDKHDLIEYLKSL